MTVRLIWVSKVLRLRTGHQDPPDLNPVENLWNVFLGHVQCQQPPPDDVLITRQALGEERQSLPQDSIVHLTRVRQTDPETVFTLGVTTPVTD